MTPIPNAKLEFGKYNGRSVATVARENFQYLLWLSSVPAIRQRTNLWRSIRAHIIQQLRAEAEDERFGDLA